MGATRLAPGKKKAISNSKQSLVDADSSLLARRGTRRSPLVVAFYSSVLCLRLVLETVRIITFYLTATIRK